MHTARTLLAVFALAACTRSAPTPGKLDDGGPLDAAAPVATFDLEPFRVRARIPGLAVAVTSGDRLVLAAASGMADAQTGAPVTVDTPFPAASLGKLVVAVTVLQDVEARRYALDDAAGAASGLPLHNPAHPRHTITVRMLLDHTSTLRDRLDEIDRGEDGGAREDLGFFLERYLARRGEARPEVYTLDDAPGERAHYSNVGPSIAARVVERANHATFDQVARDRVFGPLGMASTWSVGATTARQHVARADGSFARADVPDRALYPSSGLVASARDLAHFARVLLHGGRAGSNKMLTPSSVALLLGRTVEDGRAPAPLGFQRIVLPGEAGGADLAGHEGEDRGASCVLAIDAKTGLGVVVLANGDAFQGAPPARARALAELTQALFERARTLPR